MSRIWPIVLIAMLATPVSASAERNCAQFDPMHAGDLPQVVFIPPLEEDGTNYSPASPGRLTDVHTTHINDLLDRAICAIRARGTPFRMLRFTVYGRTDDLGAKRIVREALREAGVPRATTAAMAHAMVDVYAAWHRARVLVDRLREDIWTDVARDPSIGGDPLAMVQPGELLVDEPEVTVQAPGGVDAAHRRGFVVVLAERERPPPMSSAATACPTVNVYCCGRGSGDKANEDKPEPEKKPPADSTPILGAPRIDLMGGVAIAVQPFTRSSLYQELGVGGLGLRLPLRSVELGLRLHFAGGEHRVMFNNAPMHQVVLGGGGLLQLGGAFEVPGKLVRLALGVEGGWLYANRTVDRTDYGHVGEQKTQSGHIPVAGAWLRMDVRVRRESKWALSLEASGDLVPITTEDSTPINATVKVLGGITYEIR